MNLRIAVGILALGLAACTTPGGQSSGTTSSSSVSSDQFSVSSFQETKHVAYKGIVQPAGISIFMQGTHRLSLEDGRFILLESSTVDLNGYVNEHVEVFGSVRPTTEGDAVIMTVDEITLENPPSSESASSEVSVSSEESASSISSVSSAVNSVLSSTSSSIAVSNASSVASSLSATASSASDSQLQFEHSEALEARIVQMAADDMNETKWTQTYCTGHIGFCVPVHKNWWYQSFGTTASELWHMEMSTEALDKIHDGPISVRLMPDTLTSIGATDGQVVREGSLVIGYRSWTDARHFEILADARLEAAVRYITDKLSVYTEQ